MAAVDIAFTPPAAITYDCIEHPLDISTVAISDPLHEYSYSGLTKTLSYVLRGTTTAVTLKDAGTYNVRLTIAEGIYCNAVSNLVIGTYTYHKQTGNHH